MNAEPMSETKVCDKPAMRDLAEGVLALLGDDCFLVLNERNNENSRLKMKQSIAHAMTKGNVCHDGMKGIFVQPHCDDAKECLFLRFVGEPYVIDIDSSRRAIVCKVRVNAAFERRKAQLLGAVNSAGFRPSAETVSEMMNFEVQPVQEAGPGQPPVVNGRGLPGFVGTESRSVYAEARPSETPGLGGVVANASNDLTQDDIAEAEPPLNDGELAALRALGGELNPAQIAADADYMTREMMAGLGESDELENRDYKRSSDGRFVSTGAGQNNPRHKRVSSGNPRAKRNKTNIPANLPTNATDGELERRLRKDMDNASAHKGNQITKRGNETYSTTQKRMDHVREHVDEYLKTHPEKRGGFDTQKMNARAAKIMAQADFDADGKDAIAYGDGLKVVKSKNPKTGETEITTIYPEGKYRKQNK